MLSVCPCGDPERHVVLSRATADGIRLWLWDDGLLTGLFGARLPGIPVRRARNEKAQKHNLAVGRLFADEATLYDYDELPALFQAAESAVKADGLPGTMRSILAAMPAQGATP